MALDILCEPEKMKAYSIEMRNVDTNTTETLNLESGSFTQKPETPSSSKVNSTLLIKDKFRISNAAYHELSMLHPHLPKSLQIQKLTKELNSITNTPNDTMGVQLCLTTCITACLVHLLPSTTGTQRKICIKLTGDGTLIARGLNVVTFLHLVYWKRNYNQLQLTEATL